MPPSGWFLAVCSLGALMVAIAKRRTELAVLGPDAAVHRPVMRWYGRGRCGWPSGPSPWPWSSRTCCGRGRARHLAPGWHLVSVVPLAVALVRFDWLAGPGQGKPVEDLLARDRLMAVRAGLARAVRGWVLS